MNAVAIAPDGSWLASAGNDGAVRIWGIASGQVRATLTGHQGRAWAVAIAPDGSWLASGGDDGMVRIWDAASGQAGAVLTGHVPGRYSDRGEVRAVAIAPGGGWLASAGDDGTVRIWDAATGQARATLTGNQDWVLAVAIAHDGCWLAAGGAEVRIWATAAAAQDPHDTAGIGSYLGGVNAMAIAPDGGWLASAGDDGTVRIWDAATGQARATLTGHAGRKGLGDRSRVNTVAIAPGGGWLASGGVDGTVRIWDAATGQARAVLTGHDGTISALAIAPDGGWLASAGDDRIVRIWDAATGQARAAFTGPRDRTMSFFKTYPLALAITPDGQPAGHRIQRRRGMDTGRRHRADSGHLPRPRAREHWPTRQVGGRARHLGGRRVARRRAGRSDHPLRRRHRGGGGLGYRQRAAQVPRIRAAYLGRGHGNQPGRPVAGGRSQGRRPVDLGCRHRKAAGDDARREQDPGVCLDGPNRTCPGRPCGLERVRIPPWNRLIPGPDACRRRIAANQASASRARRRWGSRREDQHRTGHPRWH